MISLGMGNKAPEEGFWAADNGRFGPRRDAYTDEKYLAFLERHSWAKDRCLFATAPDVIGDAKATWAMSSRLFNRIRYAGYRVALVAQDGLTAEWLNNEGDRPMWNDFDALFIGGTTKWKLSEVAQELCAEAKRRGKWVHMGRVNSYKRTLLAFQWGCDSVDGTYIAFGPDLNEAKVRGWLDRVHYEPILFGASQSSSQDSSQ